MSDCVFCNIVNGNISCAKVWEDKDFLAFLDIRPVTKGMTLVIPKSHYGSYIFNQKDDVVTKLMHASKTVAKMLEKAFGVSRVAAVAEGAGVDHLHIKLYPMHGYTQDFSELSSKETKYFERYEGYISTQMGPKNSPQSLQEVADFIKSKNTNK